MRKAILFLVVSCCLLTVWAVAAQDPTATPEPTAEPQASSGIPGVVGLDVFQRASDAFDASQFEQAVVDYSLFIWLNPTSSLAHFQRGLSYIQMDDVEHALADATLAIELPSPSADFTGRAYNFRAALYHGMKNDEAAMKDLNAGIEASPDLMNLYYQRGIIYIAQNNLDDALADFNEVVRLAPDFPDVYADRGTVLAAQGKWDEAVADFSQLIELSPDDYTNYIQRATIYQQQENYEAALSDLDEALKLEPRAVSLYLRRGAVNILLGNTAAGADDYYQWMLSQRQNVTPGSLRPGESQVLQLSAGQMYILGFQAKAGQKVTITATAHDSTKTDPLIILVDEDQKLFAVDDDGGGNYDSKIEDFVIPADGVYGVFVGYAGGGSDGAVRVLLTVAD